jgi:hypothetical protein
VPPQQPDRPPDVFDDVLRFSAHDSDPLNGLDVAIVRGSRNLRFAAERRHARTLAMSNDATRARLIGTWKLVSVINEDVSTGKKTDYFGPNPAGFINYAPDGRMLVINARSDRKRPKGASPTPEEAIDLFRSVLAYAGTYTVDGNVVTHHIDCSWNESWTGTHQKRIARFEGERVHLSTEPTPDSVDGKLSVRTMTWEKLK